MSNYLAQSVNIVVPTPPGVQADFGKFLGRTVGFVFMLAGLAAFIYLIWGGVQWITSGGDKTAVEAAQHRIQAAVLGLLIVFATWAIMSVIARFLGFDIFNLNIQSLTAP